MHPPIAQRSSVSVPVQLRSIIETEINDGVYGPAGRLPSERALAERFGVSRTSVRECLDALVKDGALIRLVGKGTFVADNTRRDQHPLPQLPGTWHF